MALTTIARGAAAIAATAALLLCGTAAHAESGSLSGATTGLSVQAAKAKLGPGTHDSNGKPTTGCKTLDDDEKATASRIIVIKHLNKSGKKSVRDDGVMWLCNREGNHYVRAAGTAKGWHTNMGYNGATKHKREGDGKTPKGVFWMKDGFGTKSKPSEFTHGKYTKVTRDFVWVDGNHTKNYNTMQRKSDGYSGEPLYNNPAYHSAQVIGYNTKHTPGRGSGIFLHVHTGSGVTAGCVSINEDRLKKVFAWEGDRHTEIKIR